MWQEMRWRPGVPLFPSGQSSCEETINSLRPTIVACSKLGPVPRQGEEPSGQGPSGRVAQWGRAGCPKLVGAQEASRTELGRGGPRKPQQMGATLPVHSRRLENLRMVASVVGWLVTEVTVNLQNVNFILIHFTKSKLKLLCSCSKS